MLAVGLIPRVAQMYKIGYCQEKLGVGLNKVQILAIISTNSTTLTIRPIRREVPEGEWIETFISIHFHIENNSFKLDFPHEMISIRIRTFNEFIQDSTQYLVGLPTEFGTDEKNKPVCFFPLECAFELNLDYGWYNPDKQEGYVDLKFQIGLKNLWEQKYDFDSIGFDVNIAIAQLKDFIFELNKEISEL